MNTNVELSNEQAAAVYTDSEKALVLAGAGSGKTRVLTSRIEYLIEDCKVSPYEVLSFTFTRRAAGEMKERLEKVLGPKAHNVTMGTMHAVALGMLQRFGELIGLRPGKLTVYSSWEEQFLLKDLALELGYHTGKAWKGIKKADIDQAFHKFYTTGIRGDESSIEKKIIMNAFFARCWENNALTYGSILTAFKELIPKIKPYLKFKHILIDEVQDNDPLQWKIVNTLCLTSGAYLFAVGDLDQSIFQFRGADPDYLIRHQGDFDLYRLQTNYRSDANVVYAANKLIEHNQKRLDKTMIPFEDPQTQIRYHCDADSNGITEIVCGMINSSGDHVKRAVLARNHFMLEKLSTLLDHDDVQHDYIGKTTAFTRSEEFRRFHAFLKLIVNPHDNFSFLLIRDILGLNREEYKEIRINAVAEYKSHYQAWCDFYDPEGISHCWQAWFRASGPTDFDAVIDWMKDVDFGFNAESIFDFIYTWMLENIDKTIEDYLSWLATYDLQDEISDEPANLQLMTVHAAKGLEWPTVIIAGLNEGIFPSRQALKNNDEMESERRLAYVAFTRAEDLLVLTTRPVVRQEDGSMKYAASRFIQEVEGGLK
jgi:DNA helicase-2/ATP-dependent DNA helicase PcrA